VSPGAWPTANASTALAADRTSAGITVSRLVTRIIGLRRRRERWCNPAVRITSDTVAGGIREQLFTVGGIPGVLWTPAEGSGSDSQPVGYYGLSQGGGVGMHLVAAEPRITAAVLGLDESDVLISIAPRITIPVEFVMQWDDAGHPRDSMLTLFDALGSTAKTLHANPGSHFEVPDFEIDSSIRFFARHLGSQGAAI